MKYTQGTYLKAVAPHASRPCEVQGMLLQRTERGRTHGQVSRASLKYDISAVQ